MTKINNTLIKIFKSTAGSIKKFALSQLAISLLLFLTPIIVITSIGDIYGPPKQTLLVILVTLALFGLTLQIFKAKSWTKRKTHLIWLPILLWVGVVASAALSGAGYIAWIGTGSQGFTAVLPTTAYLIIFLVALHGGTDQHRYRWYTASLMAGILLALLYGIIEYFGWSPLTGTRGYEGFSLTGTFESLTILGTTMSLLASGMWVTADRNRKDLWMPTVKWRAIFTILGSLTILSTLFLILVADTRPTSIALLAGSSVIVALGLFDPKKFTSPTRLLLPLSFFTIALALLLFQSPLTGKIISEAEPNYSVSTEIATKTMKTDGLFGSGPGSWEYDYTRFRPEKINKTQFWQFRFDHSISHILTLSATWGVIPTLILLIFLTLTIVKLAGALVMNRSRESWQSVAVLGSVWIALLTTKFTYASNATLELTFWIITGLLIALLTNKTKTTEFKESPRIALLTSFLVVIAGLAFLFSMMLSLQWLNGELAIGKAAKLQSQNADVSEVVKQITSAVKTNRWDADYAEVLSIAYLRHIDALAADIETNAEQITQEAQITVAQARKAVELEPRNATAYESLGEIYTSLSSIITGTDALALNAFRQAVALDPNNPSRRDRLAKALVLSSDNAKKLIQDETKRQETVTQLLVEAEEEITEAIRLKPDIASQYYTRALILERQDRLEEAIDNLVALVKYSPQDAALRFELGVLQLRAGNKEFAIQDFQAAVKLAPTFANARWYLVALYEEIGETQSAIDQLEALLTLNPEDKVVQDKLNLIKEDIKPQIPQEEPEQVPPTE